MDSNIVFMVLGAEGSGTRFLTRALIEAGCAGEHGHSQQFLNGADRPNWPLIRSVDGPRVIRLSFPHARNFHDVPGLIAEAERERLRVVPVVLLRTVARTNKDYTIALMKSCLNVPAEFEPIYVVYGMFCESSDYRDFVFRTLGFPGFPRGVEVVNANLKQGFKVRMYENRL